ELLLPALAVIGARLQRRAAVEAVAERSAGLVVEDRLARVEGERLRDDLPRVLLVERARQAQRVLGLRLAQAVGDQREGGVVAQAVAQLAVGEAAVRRAVV